VNRHSHSDTLTSKHSSPGRTVPAWGKPSLLRGHFSAPRTLPSQFQWTALQPYMARRVTPMASIDPREPREQRSTCSGCPTPCGALQLLGTTTSSSNRPNFASAGTKPGFGPQRTPGFGSRGETFWFSTPPRLSTSRVNPHNHSDAPTSKHSSPGRFVPPWGKPSLLRGHFSAPRISLRHFSCLPHSPMRLPALRQWHRSIPGSVGNNPLPAQTVSSRVEHCSSLALQLPPQPDLGWP
jgi:hypothetical protein